MIGRNREKKDGMSELASHRGYRDIRAEKNPRWNGGVSQYPNHAELKRTRILALKRAQGKCETCGAPAYQIHHIDENKSNHQLDNLICLCHSCHMALHFGEEKRTSKYKRMFGRSVAEIAKLLDLPVMYVYKRVRNGEGEAIKREIDQCIRNGKEVPA